jgi:hypothetical protein
VGAVDDLWAMGKPRGKGGPWADAQVQATIPSDPYLATGYDRKLLTLSNAGDEPLEVRVEADFTGTGAWRRAVVLEVPPGGSVEHRFPPEFGAYWFRLIPATDGVATAVFHYD